MGKAETGKRGELAVARYLREHAAAQLASQLAGEGMRYAPADAVDARKRQRILTTAELYLAQNPSKKQPRLDVAEVFTKNGQVAKIHYIRNAYDGEGK